MLPVGSIVVGYRVERVLGAGGMGTVYLVANPELPRRDALKVLSTALSRDERFRARFVREADVASRLSHPNIVTIYRRGQTADGRLWIAMQYVDGVDADAALSRGQMPPERAVYIIGEIGRALDYAHHRQVIHRDVKPANFLLENTPGSDDRVLLGDFGIARALDDTSLTGTGAPTMATVAYAAPEVLAANRVDGRADLYSLGCTLFRMLTGTAPFSDARGAPAVMMAHMTRPPPQVTERAPWLPPSLDAVIATAMAKDPAHRFSSGAELAAAAHAALHPPAPAPAPAPPGFYGAPTRLVAPPPSTAAWSEPPSRRRRGKILAALAGIAVLAVAATTTVVLTSRTPGSDEPGPPPTTTESSTTTGPPPPTVSPTALDGVMLPPDQLAELIGAPTLAPYGSMNSPADDSPTIEQKECLSAWAPGQRAVYSPLGWVAARNQGFQEQPETPAFRVIQAVITLPSVAATEKLLAGQTEQWKKCANTRITLNYPQPPTPQRWTLGEPTRTDTMLSISYTMEGGVGMSCQHALTIANNVAIDVLVCRPDVGNRAVTVAETIRAKIPD